MEIKYTVYKGIFNTKVMSKALNIVKEMFGQVKIVKKYNITDEWGAATTDVVVVKLPKRASKNKMNLLQKKLNNINVSARLLNSRTLELIYSS